MVVLFHFYDYADVTLNSVNLSESIWVEVSGGILIQISEIPCD